MVEIPDPQPPVTRMVRQFHMLAAERQSVIPSQHRLLSDAYATLGGELTRLRCLESDDKISAKDKLAIYKQSSAKAEALGRLVRTLAALRQETRIAAADSIGGKAADELSDGEILQMLAEEAGPEVESLMAQYRERKGAAVLEPQPQTYKRERGPLAPQVVSADASGGKDGW